MEDYLLPFALGAVGGAAATLAAWAIVDWQLKRTIERDIPPEVSRELDRKLSSVGLDRTTGRRMAAALQAADNIGLIGIPRVGGRRR